MFLVSLIEVVLFGFLGVVNGSLWADSEWLAQWCGDDKVEGHESVGDPHGEVGTTVLAGRWLGSGTEERGSSHAKDDVAN
jgi:hypothetical protein